VPQPTAENGTPPPAADANAAATPPSPDAGAAGAAPAQTADAGGGTPPSPAGSGTFDNYTVQNGDTLMKIAFETYGDLYRWKGILEANKDKVTNPNLIPAGTVLKVEKPATPVSIEKNGEKYLIKTGDTLGTISKDVYGTKAKWKTIWENNKQMIHDPNKIFAGFYLYYQPDSTSPGVTPSPMAKGGAPANNAGTNTATTTGDTNRAPASGGGAVPPPDPGATATQ
jgi:nucleoid-associated protein YgaU